MTKNAKTISSPATKPTSVQNQVTPQATWFVSTFYFFKSLENLPQLEAALYEHGKNLELRGLFILGSEGLNSTFCAQNPSALEKFKSWIRSHFDQPELLFKDSISHIAPFPQFKVKVRPEIVTLGAPELQPPEGRNNHLNPEEWDQVLEAEQDVAVIDTRNSYEYRIGSFKGAIDPKIEQFSDFPDFVDQQKYDKDKKILIFCTGGIRCEKGILELERRGYNNVYQLEGGILNYLQKRPDRNFWGECFVFDNRVALTQSLSPSETYKLCPHCGEPGEEPITCIRCDSEALLCPRCKSSAETGPTCSKNCAHHHRLSPHKKGRPQLPPWKNNP